MSGGGEHTAAARALTDLAARFWAWRAATVPDSYDDITRVERPAGWLPDWSPAAVTARRAAVAGFAREHQALSLRGAPVPVQVDGRLLGSAIDRVRWELDHVLAWRHNPRFYVDQALVGVYNLLLVPPPWTPGRAAGVVALLRNVPAVLDAARTNLTGGMRLPFARSALRVLADVDERLHAAMSALAAELAPVDRAALRAATAVAADALVSYRDWLTRSLSGCSGATAVGAASFSFFLHRVALLPYRADELRAMGRQEWHRAVAAEAVLRERARDVPAAVLPDADRQIARQAADEALVRRFYTDRRLLSQPDSLRHYRFACLPAYLAPLTWLGVPHHAAGPSTVDDDAVRYVPPPHEDLPYFPLADARDPKVGIAHEGAHAQQLALSWRHPNPVRRHYYDSAANEGIAFYNEELLLLAGLYEDNPASAAFVANATRLRALRVEVDIALALGDLDLTAAAERLAVAVPMDEQTAWEEAVFFAGNPGQGLSFQTGKLQIADLLSAARTAQGSAFDLMAFHDRLWREGNVPFSLQRWELLGLRDHLDRADRHAGILPG